MDHNIQETHLGFQIEKYYFLFNEDIIVIIILHKFHEEIDTSVTVNKEIYFKSCYTGKTVLGWNRRGGWCKERKGPRRCCGSLSFAILFGNP